MRLVLCGVWAAWLLVGCASGGGGGGEPDGALPELDASVDTLCGNGTIDGAEACDDGNRNGGDYCADDCTRVTGECGDGIQQSNEVCDGDVACTPGCTRIPTVCGNGIVEPGETCDPGNTSVFGCRSCRASANTLCDGEPSICGPADLDARKPLRELTSDDFVTYCRWLTQEIFQGSSSISCGFYGDAIPRPPSECAMAISAAFDNCTGPVHELSDCYDRVSACDTVFNTPGSETFRSCIASTCADRCTPDTWSCEGNTARLCNEYGNRYATEFDCGSGTCNIASLQPTSTTARACGLAICVADTWTCEGNTARRCATDELSYVERVECGTETCTPGDPTATMDEICDVDECANGTMQCDEHATCVNLPGSAYCQCNAGFSGNGVSCIDLNECTGASAVCDNDPVATCTNTPGSFTCECPSGYEGDGVGYLGCNQADECANGTHDCDENAQCTNNDNGYTCACNVDFQGDGFSCVASPHLISLVPSIGRLDFRADRLNYAIRVPAATASIEITATSYHGTPYQVNGGEVASGETSAPITLDTEPHTITVTYDTRTYTIQVRRSGVTFLKPATFDAGDEFGAAVASDGTWMVVGAPGEDSAATGVDGDAQDNSATDSGAAYVFENVGGTWTQRAYLKASVVRAGARFGHSVGISGRHIIIGAPNDTTNGIANSGAVYVSSRPVNTWSAPRAVTAAGWMAGDRVGVSVAIAGTFAIVGAEGDDSGGIGASPQNVMGTRIDSGAAYLLELSSDWYVSALIKAPNPDPGDGFGHAVAVHGDRAVIGAPGEDSSSVMNPGDNSLANCGALYIVSGLGSGDYVLTYLKDDYGDLGGSAGSSVAIQDNHAVSGGAGHTIVHTLQPTGLWTRTHGTGSFNARPNDPNIVAAGPNGYLGGAPLAPDGMGVGHIWGYSWSNQGDGRAGGPYFNTLGQRFGASVAISGTTWVVGAPGDAADANANGNAYPDSGAVYVF